MANDLLPTDTGRFPSSAMLTHGGAGAPFLGPSASTATPSTTTHLTATPLSTTSTFNTTAPTTTTTLNSKNDFFEYDEDQPCEKYKQFLDSSRQERTFMIQKLVEIFANVIDSIWHPKFMMEQQQNYKVIPTRGFCTEILRRSNTTYATLQISLFYVFRIKKVVHEKLFRRYQASKNPQMKLPPQTHLDDLMCCGRRMFLASLMVASKYLHDKNYHNKAWSKITGLDIKEINAAEMAFLMLIDYRLHVSKPTFDKWYTQLHGHIQKERKSAMSSNNPFSNNAASPFSINRNAITTMQSLSSQQDEARRLNSNNHEQTYPSPPPDMNATRHANPSSSFAPPSPPMVNTATSMISATASAAQTINIRLSNDGQQVTPAECRSNTGSDIYSRADSGVSFDILSPPSSQKQPLNSPNNNLEQSNRSTGIKRHSDEDLMAFSCNVKRHNHQQ